MFKLVFSALLVATAIDLVLCRSEPIPMFLVNRAIQPTTAMKKDAKDQDERGSLAAITNENDAGGNNDTEEKRPKRKIYRKKMPVEMVRRFRNLYHIATIENIIDELLDSLLLTL